MTYLSRTVVCVFLALLCGMFSLNCAKKSISAGADLGITVEPDILRFTNIAVFTSETQTISVKHSGSEGVLEVTASLSKDTSGDYKIEGPDGSLTIKLNPGESKSFKVTLTPADAEVDTGWAVFKHNIAGLAEKRVRLISFTPEQSIVVDPNPIDFGDLQAGATKTVDVRIFNLGSDTITVTALNMAQNSSPDFKIESSPPLPILIPSSTNITVKLSYTPTGGGQDTGSLSIVSNDPNDPELNVLVLGNQPAPEIEVSPGTVDFGAVAINDSKSIKVTVKNIGTQDLTVKALGLSLDTNKSVKLENAPTLPKVLKFNETLTVDVTFSPTIVEDLKGSVVIDSDDENEGRVQLPIKGRTAAAKLQVIPQKVDLGIVASGIKKTSEVTLYNAGELPLDITSLTLSTALGTGEFELDTTGISFPVTLGAAQSLKVNVSFTNNGADNGTENATIKVVSTDPQNPNVDVPVTAARGGAPECMVKLQPSVLNFGIVARGSSKTLQMNLVNVGSGPCTYVKTVMGNPTSNQIATNDGVFRLIPPVPTSSPGGLAPGDVVSVNIKFTPPLTASLFDLSSYQACVFVQVTDAISGKVVNTPKEGECGTSIIPGGFPIPFPIPGAGSPNLIGASGFSELTVLPSDVNFGKVRVGCASKLEKVSIYNVGDAPLNVTDIQLQGCSAEFQLLNTPAQYPVELDNSAPIVINVYYEPTDLSADSCNLVVLYGDQGQNVETIPLTGEGTDTDFQKDEFVQLSGQKVDILFIVDNSGSMSEEQENLANNFKALIQEAKKWDNDIQLGVISVEIEENGPRTGKLQFKSGKPRILRSFYTKNGTPDYVQLETDFVANVQLGDNYSGAQEAGLEAARLALSPPLGTNTNTTCNSDSDCLQGDLCKETYPDDAQFGSWPVKMCGGYNVGFLRKDATLELVFISDEEDQSPGAVDFYVDFLKSIKGYQNTGLMHAHVIVGPKGGCSSDFGSAAEGLRYIEVANQTGGQIASICDANFATALTNIGKNAFGLKVQFFLSRPAIESTIKVTVQGVQTSTGWSYDTDSNSIIFQQGSVPQPNDKISVEYTAMCFQY